MERSIENKMSDPQKPFQCKICKVCYASKHALNRHVSLNHDQAKSFDCKICDSKFSKKEELKKHCYSSSRREAISM